MNIFVVNISTESCDKYINAYDYKPTEKEMIKDAALTLGRSAAETRDAFEGGCISIVMEQVSLKAKPKVKAK